MAYIYDSDSKKWGEAYQGCKVFLPEELADHGVSFVVITVLDTNIIGSISSQLDEYGISYCDIDEWLKLII